MATTRGRRRLWLGLQIAGTALGLAYVAWVADLGAAFDAARQAGATVLLLAVVLGFASLSVGALRWRVLLSAYGAEAPPPIGRLVWIYLVGLFYNAYLPGGIGGDVVRGIVTREAFGQSGATSGVTVVMVERALGVSGLLLVCSAALAVRPLRGAIPSEVALGLAIGLAIAVLASVSFARRIAPYLPGFAGRLAASLPTIRRPGGLVVALALSVVTQVGVALSGHVVLAAVEPRATLADSFFIVPLAAATAFLPFTVGGAGAREAAFVALASEVLGTSADRAAAASLMLWASQLLVAGSGGLLQLFWPVDRGAREARSP